MEPSMVEEIEKIIGYSFKKKKLIEEALTHCSVKDEVSYERLEFIGDPILNLAITNYLLLNYPKLQPSTLSLLRAVNISTEKLARAAVRHKLHRYVRHNADHLIPKVQKFVDAVALEDQPVLYGGSTKAPKVLADIFESIVGAIYTDVDFDLQILWGIIKDLMEPIVTPDELEQMPQPVTMLFELCQKNAKHVEIKCLRNNNNESVVDVFVEGELVATASSEHKYIAKLEATKIALNKLSHLVPTSQTKINIFTEKNGALVIASPKLQLNNLCTVKKWPKPVYRIEKDSGPLHNKRYVCEVQVTIGDDILQISGDEKTRKKEAENSAACFMIHALQKKSYL